MRIVKRMPKTGQFIAFWVHEGKIWGHTYEWRGGEIYRYDQGPDEYEKDPLALEGLKEQGAQFLIL